MLSYAVGAVAYGVKDSGFGTFLLLFYNQVLGLPAATVGLVIMVALLVDAMIDPAVGFFSDRTRSRWGRRHPWMYASAVPIAVGWLLLWNPPALSESMTLLWLFLTAVVVRSAVSAYEVPSVALTSELTADYDERTRIMAYRYLLGWAGGLTMLLAAYTLFLPTDAAHPRGLLERSGYASMAWVGAAAMFIAILVSAIGTHKEIGRLPRAPANGSLGASFRELGATVKNRGFVILMAAGLCLYTNQGISFALSNYLYTHVWRFDKSAFIILAFTLFTGVVIAFTMAPRIARRIGKPKAAALLMSGAVFLLTLPYWLRLVGWFPEPGDPQMLPLLFAIFTCNTACSVSAMILGRVDDGGRGGGFGGQHRPPVGGRVLRGFVLHPEMHQRSWHLPRRHHPVDRAFPRNREAGHGAGRNGRPPDDRFRRDLYRAGCDGRVPVHPLPVRARGT